MSTMYQITDVLFGADIEKKHIEFLKSILCVKKSMPNYMVFFALGQLPLLYTRKQYILKLWCKRLFTNNVVLQDCYSEMLGQCEVDPNCKNWLACVQHELDSLGFSDYWLNQHNLNVPLFLATMKQRVRDQCQ